MGVTNQVLLNEFMGIYNRLYAQKMTMTKAYDEAEKLFITKYGHRKYSSFQSFNVSMYQRIKKEIKQVS